MTARIFRPARNPMQSGKGKSSGWVLVYEPDSAREIEPLLGHTSSSDMQSQIRLSFATKQDAEAYANKEGLAYRVDAPHDATAKRVAYPDNFRNDRKTPWTH